LGGSRLSLAGLPPEDVIVEMIGRPARYGQAIDTVVTPFSFYSSLIKAMGTRVQYVDRKLEPIIAPFKGVRVVGSDGEVDVFPDYNCPSNRAYGLDLQSWELFSTGPAIMLLEDDDNSILRASASDSLEVRIGFQGNLVCHAPGANVVATI
jgi:hypothetical protein